MIVVVGAGAYVGFLLAFLFCLHEMRPGTTHQRAAYVGLVALPSLGALVAAVLVGLWLR